MNLIEDYLSEAEKKAIQDAIVKAEELTSGEIRVFFEPHCPSDDPFERGLLCFHALEMQKTKLQNGVLLYLALQDHKFAIIADKGINEKVPDNFWDTIVKQMSTIFSEEGVVEGLVHGISKTGVQLAEFFPLSEEDVNELPNEIVFGLHEEE